MLQSTNPSFSGYYLYMETTNIGETAVADLYSPLIKGNLSSQLGGEKLCLAFWYHMHGAGIGEYCAKF